MRSFRHGRTRGRRVLRGAVGCLCVRREAEGEEDGAARLGAALGSALVPLLALLARETMARVAERVAARHAPRPPRHLQHPAISLVRRTSSAGV